MIHHRHPLIIAWWSAAFPGFGHLLMCKYWRGYILFVWEVLINTQANLNLALLYTFIGDIPRAKAVLDPRWMLLYIPTYLFAIWDSYRTAVDMNKISTLAEHEKAHFPTFAIGSMEINYLDKRNPVMAVFWSLFMPGMGHLYIHRIVTAFFALLWLIVMVVLSRVLEGVYFLVLGDMEQARQVVVMEWLLFMPSLYGFCIYDSYVNTVENNKLFDQVQRKYLIDHFQTHAFQMPTEAGGYPMYVFSTFDHSVYLELAISTLQERGIARDQILAVPLDIRREKRKLFDDIHHSDGTSLMDIGMAFSTGFAVVGASVGYILPFGPIVWGLIGAGSGFLIGFSLDKWLTQRKLSRRHKSKSREPEVILVVQCQEHQVKEVEELLWEHLAIGVSIVGKSADNPM